MAYRTIIYEMEDPIGIITLNRPDQKNAINIEMIDELLEIAEKIVIDADIRAVILTGGDKFFCAGADITMLDAVSSPLEAYDLVGPRRNLSSKLERIEKPLIAAISGEALGGGCELALACDLRIADDTAIFGQPEIRFGILPPMGATQRLPRLVGIAKAKEMIYLGDFIDAKEAYRIGLVNKIVPGESLMGEVKKIAMRLAEQPPIALRFAKSLINYGINLDLELALEYERQVCGLLFSTSDREEGLKAFLEKRKAIFSGK